MKLFIVMDLNEQISRMQSMMGIIDESRFFHRRVDLDEVKGMLKFFAQQTFYDTKSYEQFKYELTLRAVEHEIYQKHGIGWEDLPEEPEIKFVTEVSNLFEDIIKALYDNYDK